MSATAANVIWIVIPEGCGQANPDLDQQDRVCSGRLVLGNLSTGIDGLYGVVLYEENKLGGSANVYYGFDTVSVGFSRSALPTLDGQIIAGTVTNGFFLRTLALSPISQEFTSYTTGAAPDVLGTLRSPSDTLVPSTTWAYTSGAVYKSPPVLGRVTFGGHDAEGIDLSDSKERPACRSGPIHLETSC